MELHFWLIPIMAILIASIAVFYVVIQRTGGSGVRNEGRTVFDKPVKKEEEAKGDWNYYGKP